MGGMVEKAISLADSIEQYIIAKGTASGSNKTILYHMIIEVGTDKTRNFINSSQQIQDYLNLIAQFPFPADDNFIEGWIESLEDGQVLEILQFFSKDTLTNS